MMRKAGQHQGKLLAEMPTPGRAALESTTLFGYPVPVTLIGAGYFGICSSGNHNWSWTFKGIPGFSKQLHKEHKLCWMPQTGM